MYIYIYMMCVAISVSFPWRPASATESDLAARIQELLPQTTLRSPAWVMMFTKGGIPEDQVSNEPC